MIKSGEYIQLIMFFQSNLHFLFDYSRWEQIEEIEAIKRLDELRILHNKYKVECENWNVYPHKDLTKLNMIKEDIKRISREFKIRVEFFEPKHLSFKKGFHAAYFHEGTNITDLIIFNTKREDSSTSR